MEKRDVVIIGGGPAGRVAVHTLHAGNPGLSITLIKDEAINVNRCAVPYGIPMTVLLEKFQIPNSLVTDFGAELIIDRVKNVDTQKQTVHTDSGKSLGYRDLVLATGARPVIPPLPGADLPLITPVRYLSDLSRLKAFAAAGQRAVVVGGGYIGIEVAVELRRIGIEVSVVEMLPNIMMETTEPEFIADIENRLVANHVRLLTGTKVASFEQPSKHEIVVYLEGGHTVTADFVVLSAGVALNTELAAAAGLKTSRLGVWTDDFLQTSAPHVYASGDCVEKRSFITGKPCRGEFGTNAVFMSKVVGQNILGKKKRFPGVVNANATSVFGWSLGQAGLTEHMADDAGIRVVTGMSQVPDKYPMMDGVAPVHTKLIFNGDTRKLIGGCILRKGVGAAQCADFISLAIQMGSTVDDLLVFQYATHPEQAAKPSHNIFTVAAKDAIGRM